MNVTGQVVNGTDQETGRLCHGHGACCHAARVETANASAMGTWTGVLGVLLPMLPFATRTWTCNEDLDLPFHGMLPFATRTWTCVLGVPVLMLPEAKTCALGVRLLMAARTPVVAVQLTPETCCGDHDLDCASCPSLKEICLVHTATPSPSCRRCSRRREHSCLHHHEVDEVA